MDAGPPKRTGAQPGNATRPWLGLRVASPAQSLLKSADRQTALAFRPLDCIAHSKLISHIRLVLLFFSSSNSSAHFADEEAETQGALAAFLRPCSVGAVKRDSARSPDRLGLWPLFPKGCFPQKGCAQTPALIPPSLLTESPSTGTQ